MGTIYRSGRIWWIQYYRNGRRYQESSLSTGKMVAASLLKQREGDVAKGKVPGIHFDRVTFDELAEDFLRDYRLNAKKDLRRTERRVRELASVFRGLRAPDINTARIKAYIEKRLNEGKAPATVNRELAALRRMINLGRQCTPPKVDQVPHIPMLKDNNIRKGFFEHHEYMALMDALPDYLKPVVAFGYRYGWRHGEILGLTWDRVDLKAGIVRLEPGTTKNDQGRTVYLDDDMREMLRALFVQRRLDVQHVFLKDGKPIRSFRKAWRTACRRAGLRGRLFHDFRRTAVRNMVRAGVPERVAMQVSGHKSRSVFDRYNIVSDADLREAAKRHGDYLASGGLSQSQRGISESVRS